MECKVTAIRVVAMALMLLSSHAYCAQYVTEDSLPHAPRPSIQVLVTSPLSYTMGADPRIWRWGTLMRFGTYPYRRHRVGAFYDVLNGRGDDETEELTTITGITDSTVSFLYRRDASWRAAIRYGWEWTHPVRRIAPYYAVEVIAGYQYNEDTRKEVVVGTDTSQTGIVPDASALLYERTFRCDRVHYALVGAAFTAGWRFQLAKGWMVSIQLSPEVYLPIFKSAESCDGLPLQASAIASGADVRLRIAEILVGWTF